MCGIGAACRERHRYVLPGTLRGLLDGSVAAQHDQVCQRHLLATLLATVEVLLDDFERLQHLRQFRRAVHRPAVLWRQANACTVGTTTHVRAAERRGRGPSRTHQLGTRQAGSQHLGLQLRDVRCVHERVVNHRQRVLPRQHFLRRFGTQVAAARAEVAVRQLEPGLGERQLVLGRVLLEALDDLAVGRVELQRQVRGEHDGRVALGGVVCIRHELRVRVARHPLRGTTRALRLHPVEAQQVVEVLRSPLRGRRRPRAFQAASHGIAGVALAALVGPAHALLLDAGSGGFRTHALGRVMRTVCLAEGVATGNQRDGFFIVHGHAAEGVADVARGRQWVRLAVRALRVHVDKAHLHGAQRTLQLAVASVALVRQELAFRAPVHFIGLPVVCTAAGEAEGLEAHGFERHVAGEHHQVAPGECAAILLLDGPHEATRLVEVGVVRPAVQRLEAQLPAIGTTTAVERAVGAGAVPRHADEERAIVAVVRRPPRLRRGQHLADVRLHGVQVQLAELGGVVELGAVGIRLHRVLAQRTQVQQAGPPVPVLHGTAARGSGRSGSGFVGGHGRGRGREKGSQNGRRDDRECSVTHERTPWCPRRQSSGRNIRAQQIMKKSIVSIWTIGNANEAVRALHGEPRRTGQLTWCCSA